MCWWFGQLWDHYIEGTKNTKSNLQLTTQSLTQIKPTKSKEYSKIKNRQLQILNRLEKTQLSQSLLFEHIFSPFFLLEILSTSAHVPSGFLDLFPKLPFEGSSWVETSVTCSQETLEQLKQKLYGHLCLLYNREIG